MYLLRYFKLGSSICADDLLSDQEIMYINEKLISTISDVKKFTTPLSGIYKGTYAFVKMNNGDVLNIREYEYLKLLTFLKCALNE